LSQCYSGIEPAGTQF